MLKRLSGLFGREQKQSATGTLTAINLIGKPVWTPRNYTALATEGFAKNAIAYRCIRMISEACASIPLRVEFEGRRVADHPLQKLIDRPNPEQGGADLREALYGGLQTAGNASSVSDTSPAGFALPPPPLRRGGGSVISKIHSLNFGKGDRPPEPLRGISYEKCKRQASPRRCLPLETIGFRTHLYRGGTFYSGK